MELIEFGTVMLGSCFGIFLYFMFLFGQLYSASIIKKIKSILKWRVL